MCFVRIVGLFFFGSVAALCVAASAHAIAFQWPDSSTHPRVILAADQDVEEYLQNHPDWFASDFLVAGLYVKDVAYGQSDAAMEQMSALYSELRQKHILSGSYISGTTALHELTLTKYPANAASIEDMSLKVHYLGPWIREPDQQVVDLKDGLSRHELQFDIRELWLHIPVVMRFVDNAAVHPRVARMQPWNVYCDNISALRGGAEAGNGNAVFNIFVRPWEMSNDDMKQLINAVAGNGGNGVSFPLPWSKSIKDDKNALGWAIYRYRQLLDHHISVILVPSDDAPQNDLYNWMYSWRRPGDRLYIAWPYWEAPPGS